MSDVESLSDWISSLSASGTSDLEYSDSDIWSNVSRPGSPAPSQVASTDGGWSDVPPIENDSSRPQTRDRMSIQPTFTTTVVPRTAPSDGSLVIHHNTVLDIRNALPTVEPLRLAKRGGPERLEDVVNNTYDILNAIDSANKRLDEEQAILLKQSVDNFRVNVLGDIVPDQYNSLENLKFKTFLKVVQQRLEILFPAAPQWPQPTFNPIALSKLLDEAVNKFELVNELSSTRATVGSQPSNGLSHKRRNKHQAPAASSFDELSKVKLSSLLLNGSLQEEQILLVTGDQVSPMHNVGVQPERKETATTISTDGRLVALAYDDGLLRVLDSTTGKIHWEIRLWLTMESSFRGGKYFTWLYFVMGNTKLVGEDNSGTVLLCDVKAEAGSGEKGSKKGRLLDSYGPFKTFHGLGLEVRVARSPDSTMIVRTLDQPSAWWANMIVLHFGEDGISHRKLEVPPTPTPTQSKPQASQGLTLASGSWPNPTSNQHDHDQRLVSRSLGFSPDNKNVGGFSRSTAHVWSVETEEHLYSHPIQDCSQWLKNTWNSASNSSSTAFTLQSEPGLGGINQLPSYLVLPPNNHEGCAGLANKVPSSTVPFYSARSPVSKFSLVFVQMLPEDHLSTLKSWKWFERISEVCGEAYIVANSGRLLYDGKTILNLPVAVRHAYMIPPDEDYLVLPSGGSKMLMSRLDLGSVSRIGRDRWEAENKFGEEGFGGSFGLAGAGGLAPMPSHSSLLDISALLRWRSWS